MLDATALNDNAAGELSTAASKVQKVLDALTKEWVLLSASVVWSVGL